jgi:hypothetical protein
LDSSIMQYSKKPQLIASLFIRRKKSNLKSLFVLFYTRILFKILMALSSEILSRVRLRRKGSTFVSTLLLTACKKKLSTLSITFWTSLSRISSAFWSLQHSKT